MVRVAFALLGVAFSLALLVVALDLGRTPEGTARAAVIMFVCVLGLGYPVLGLFCKRGWWQAWKMILLGILAGILCALPFHAGPFGFRFLLLVYGISGGILGGLFWLTALWRNDELTCPKSFCLPCGVYRVARRMLVHKRDLG